MGFHALILDPPLISSGHATSWSLVSHHEVILEGWGTVMVQVSAGFSIELGLIQPSHLTAIKLLVFKTSSLNTSPDLQLTSVSIKPPITHIVPW